MQLVEKLNGAKVIDYSTKETAGFIRLALKAAFPSQKFSIRTSYASMTSSTDIKWLDGPTEAEVEHVTNAFTSKSFDGMTDSTNYHNQEVNGQLVSYSGWIHLRREFSVALLGRALAKFQAERALYGFSPAALQVIENGSCNYVHGPDANALSGISKAGYQYCCDAVQTIAAHIRPNGCKITMKSRY